MEIAHSIPGRIRLRLAAEEVPGADLLVRRLHGHPGVRAVRWNPAARSLTIGYERSSKVAVALELPAAQHPAPRAIPAPAGIVWSKVLFACILSLIPLGPLGGLALSAAASILEQRLATTRSAA